MGLDVVEVIMAVEERFGISIPDDAGEELWTIGGLHQYVMRKLQEVHPPEICFTSSTFYALRRGLMKTAGMKRSEVRPDLELRSAIPFLSRRGIWPQLRRESGLPLPSLEWHNGVIVAIGTITLGLLFWLRSGADYTWQFSFLLCVATSLLLVLLAVPFRASIPDQCHTVRQLVYATMPRQGITADRGSWEPEKVWGEIRKIVSCQLGVDPAIVTSDADWKQLGAD